MDEEYTFRKLKKSSFNEISDILYKVSLQYLPKLHLCDTIEQHSRIYADWAIEELKTLDQYGWTLEEYKKAYHGNF